MQFISALCLPSGICNTGANERNVDDEYTWRLSCGGVVRPACSAENAMTRCMN